MIHQNHGLITVGTTVDEAAWWLVAMERSCRIQLLAEAAGTPTMIPPAVARETGKVSGSHYMGWFGERAPARGARPSRFTARRALNRPELEGSGRSGAGDRAGYDQAP